MLKSPVVAIAWFRPADWPRLLAVASDRARLPPAFAEFERRAGLHLAALQRQGMRAEPVLLDVDELVSWCHTQGRPVDSASRAEYAARTARRRGLN